MQANGVNVSYNCIVCLSEITIPCKINCGHFIDFNCIGTWLKNEHDNCPLDRKKIEAIEPQNLDPTNTVSLEFNAPSGQLKFFATLNATVQSVADVWSAYNEIMYIAQSKPSSDSITKVKGIDIQNISSGWYHGRFSLEEEKSLKDIPLIAGESYRVRVHVFLKD